MEALEAGGCPFCTFYNGLEDNALRFLMGPSVAYMEDDVRMETNRLGFCKPHYERLYHSQNRLGLALMLHTHIETVLKKGYAPTTKLKKKVEKESCYMCNMVEGSYARYVDTFFHLFAKEDRPKELILQGEGFCMPHLGDALEQAAKKLSGQKAKDFVKIVTTKQNEQLEKVYNDLDWFIKKFDYRFADEPWKDSKDAIERAIARLTKRLWGDKDKPKP